MGLQVDATWRIASCLVLGAVTVACVGVSPPLGRVEEGPSRQLSSSLKTEGMLVADRGVSPPLGLVADAGVSPPLDRVEEGSLEKSASSPEPGRKLIADLGCPVCHEIQGHETTIREEAPDLSYEGELIRPDWLFTFLKNPSRIRPAIKGRMPDFRLDDEEALAITEYLTSLKDDEVRPLPEEGQDKGNPSPVLVEAGKKLTSKEYLDCFKCHVLGEKKPGGDPSEWAPDLTRVRQRINPDGLLSWLRNPPRYRPNTKMPVFFPDQDSGPEDILEGDEGKQILALRAFLLSIGQEEPFPEYDKAKKTFPDVGASEGRSLMVKLNCVGCHNVATLPDGKKVAPSLNTEGSRVRKEWLYEFLKHPRTIKPEYAIMGSFARMPDFHLTDEEARVLTDYIARTLVDKTAPTDLFSDGLPPDLVRKGEELFEEKLCHNCHRIGSRAGGIGPNLTKAEQRLNPGWVYRFILNPSHYLETRMPNLQVTEEEAKAITAYLMSQKEP